MKQNKLINLLQSLTPSEFNNLGDYTNSPFFIKRRVDLPAFYKVLKKYYPFDNLEELTKEALFKAVYYKQAYNDKKFRKLQSDFVKIVEHYLLYLDNEEDKFEKDMRLVTIYGRRGIYDEFTKGTKSLKKQLDEKQLRDAKHYLRQYELGRNYYFNINTKKNKENLHILKSTLKYFENYFVLNRVDFGIELKSRNNILKENNQFKIDCFKEIIPTNNPVYKIYYHSFNLINKPNFDKFLELKKIFKENLKLLGEKDQSIIFSILENFVIQQIIIDEKKFLQIGLELYEIGIKHKIIFENQKLHPIIFLNVIIISAKLKRFNWTTLFIKNNYKFLPTNLNEATKYLAYGYVEFHKENYLVAIDKINKSNELNNFFISKSTILSIRCYFKLFQKDKNYFNILHNMCLACIKTLERNNNSAQQKIQSSLGLIKSIKKLAILLMNDKLTNEKKEGLLNYVNTQPIRNKGWLIDQIETM